MSFMTFSSKSSMVRLLRPADRADRCDLAAAAGLADRRSIDLLGLTWLRAELGRGASLRGGALDSKALAVSRSNSAKSSITSSPLAACSWHGGDDGGSSAGGSESKVGSLPLEREAPPFHSINRPCDVEPPCPPYHLNVSVSRHFPHKNPHNALQREPLRLSWQLQPCLATRMTALSPGRASLSPWRL